MQAKDLQQFFQTLIPGWEYPPDTVDTFKSGDPEDEVRGIAVGWMGYTWALKQAIELGCNLFVTHEPTYYNHHDNYPAAVKNRGVKEKQRWIEENRLTILRCHDLWDRMEKVGIADAWGEFLGFTQAVGGNETTRIYRVEQKTAVQVALKVAARTERLGQPAVQLIGPEERIVEKVSVGTGAITPFIQTVNEFDIDLAICTDDGIDYWKDGAYAIDLQIPLIIVNHPVSEEFGIFRLAELIGANFPKVPVHHIPQRCMFRLVESQTAGA